jgi:hypothetical protein
MAINPAGEDTARIERPPVDRLDETDLILADLDHVHLRHLVEERREDVQAWRENPRLDADLAAHGDDAPFGQAPPEQAPFEGTLGPDEAVILQP